MRRNHRGLLWLGISILAVLSLSAALLVQASPDFDAAAPVVTDWTHHHVIFSRPATAERAERVERDPRYWQQLRRQSPAVLPDAETEAALPSRLPPSSHESRGRNKGLSRDWAEDMGTGATIGAGNYPAKFSFNSTTASCTSDFVVYNTGLLGASSQASIVAYNNLYSGCSEINLGTAANFAMLASSTITSAGASVVTGGNIGISPGTSLTGFPPGVLTAPAVEHLGDAVAAQAQADASTAYTFYQGLTGGAPIAPVLDGLTFTPGLYKAASTLSLSAGQTVTLNGSGTYIFQIGSTLTLAGSVVLSGGATAGNVIWLVGSSATINAGAAAIGDILAVASITLNTGASVTGRAIALSGAVTMIDNGITTVDMVPAIYWAYNTGGKIVTSPVLSVNGAQVVFVQSTGGDASLVLLKWAASTGTVGTPVAPTSVSNSAYPTCTAPCMTTLALVDLSVAVDDSNSSAFYDYGDDTAYVGDDSGYLHKFTPVFLGTQGPSEVTTGSWPTQLNPGAATALTNPVYDFVSTNVFVEDKGGFLYRVDSSGTPTQSGLLDHSTAFDTGPGMVQGPIVDSSAGLVYVFATSDGSAGCGGGRDCASVYIATTSFAANNIPAAPGAKVKVGISTAHGTAPKPLYIGAFDSAYENSADPPTGNLYVCGATGVNPTLYRVPIASGAFGTVAQIVTTTAPLKRAACGPVTDVSNPNTAVGTLERVFFSVQNNGVPTLCAGGGCALSFVDTPWQANTFYNVGQEILVLQTNAPFINVAIAAGTTAGTQSTWPTTAGVTTVDGGVTWLTQGDATLTALGNWISGHDYTLHTRILDSNGNVEIATTTGNSGGTAPNWNTTAGGLTADGAETWINAGVLPSAALPATGGTSGFIIDNVVGLGTQVGASQVYFSTLGDQACTGGTGGCAVQASQSSLQ